MGELKTEPGYLLPRTPRTRRPWWVALVIGGLSTGVGIVATLGLGGMHGDARGDTPMRMSAVAPPTQEDRDARLSRIESKVDEALQRIAHIEGRMDRGR